MKIKVFAAVVSLCLAAAGCASVPKPKSVGQTIGSAIDSTITWSAHGIQKLLNK